MNQRKTEFSERPPRVQTFTNLQSVNPASFATSERNKKESFYAPSDPALQPGKLGFREVTPTKHPEPNLSSAASFHGNPKMDVIPVQAQSLIESNQMHGSHRQDDERDFQGINLKKFKIDDFDLGMKLGKGKFGAVYLAREKATNYIVALKILNKLEIQRLTSEKLIVREIKIHSFVDHPNIIKLYGFFHDEQNIYLILEYAPDGEVYKELKKAVG